MGRYRSVVLWALLVAVICLLPRNAVPEPGLLSRLHADKIAHLLLFGVLQVLVLLSIDRERPRTITHFVSGIAVVTYGGSIELLQQWMALGRNASLYDLIADAIGVVLGSLAVMLYLRRDRKAIN